MRVGGAQLIPIEARLITATHRDLEDEVLQGRFRKDLYYRLSVFPITLPPLRERREDIALLVHRLLEHLRETLGMGQAPQLEPGVIESLESYHWPGNVRELRNVLERALMLSPDGVIRLRDLNMKGLDKGWQLQVAFPEGESLNELTKRVAREVVREALRRAKTKKQAAQLLGISRHALAHQLKALGLERDSD
jgi:transcriptional regulator with PAS, ATPase and Fis domain